MRKRNSELTDPLPKASRVIGAILVAVIAGACAPGMGAGGAAPICDAACEVATAERTLTRVAASYDRLDEAGAIDPEWYSILDPLLLAADMAVGNASATVLAGGDPNPYLNAADAALAELQRYLASKEGTGT